MRTLINNLMGRISLHNDWKAIRQVAIIAIAPALFVGLVFTWQIISDQSNNSERVLSVTDSLENSPKTNVSTPSEGPQNTSIFIDISGAVNSPGIKELSKEARVNDGIWSAQGYTTQADREYIAQVLNLAQPLNDGDKIYIPTYAEVANSLPNPPILLNKIKEPINVLSGVKAETSIENSQTNSQNESNAKVNINTATQSQIEELPGIGEVNAKNIINGRPYTSVSELCEKKVVTSASTCEKIKDLITL